MRKTLVAKIEVSMPRNSKVNTVPKAQLVLGYREIFKVAPPIDRLSLVSGICKRNLIVELAGLNYRLKPKNSKHQDTSLQTQAKELRYFCNNDDSTLKTYTKVAHTYTKSKTDYPLIFIRQSCLFALEEIIQSDMKVIENFNVSRPEVWDAILKYLLAVNSELTAIQKEDEDEPVTFEKINPKMLPLNELNVSIDPIYTPYRGYRLLEYLSTSPELKNELKLYFEKTYSATFEYFIYEILGMYLGNKTPDPEHQFYYNVTEHSKTLFDTLSKKQDSGDTIKLLSIKKYPFYKSEANVYVLLDNILLLEKSYSQFINDFWFDHIKKLTGSDGKPLFNTQRYRSLIGYFFENYVRETVDYCFAESKHYTIKSFDELKINKKGGEIEIADLYIRYDSKILLGQVKSTSIYDNEKYGKDLNALYKNDRNGFFDSFGLNQLVESIIELENNIIAIDPGFPKTKSYKLFPILIVNEKALQAPLMGEIFQNRFLELIKDYKNYRQSIYPISIMHISDLENIQEFIHDGHNEIWDLLKYHCRYPEFMPPFYNSIYRKDIRANYRRSVELYENLISKYNIT